MQASAAPDALDHLDRMAGRIVPEAPDVWLDLAGGWLQRGDLDRAEGHAFSALEQAPDNPRALELMGLVRLRRGRTENGLSWLQRAVAAGGGPEVHYNLSRAHLALGQPEAARAELERAVALRPTFTLAGVGRRGDRR